MIVEICRVQNFLVSSHFENQQYLLNVGFREFGEFTGYFPPNSQTGTQWVDFVFELVFYFLYLKSKFYKKRGATFFYDVTRKLGPLDFTQYRSKSSSF